MAPMSWFIWSSRLSGHYAVPVEADAQSMLFCALDLDATLRCSGDFVSALRTHSNRLMIHLPSEKTKSQENPSRKPPC